MMVFSIKEEHAVFSVKGGEECIFSLSVNKNVTEQEPYEQLFCKDGTLYASDGKPIYVLKWNIETN